jgi:cytochrome c peroxidase
MTRRARWRIRWTLLVAAWVLAFIPTIRSQQTQAPPPSPPPQLPGIVTVTPVGPPATIRFVGRGRTARRLADMTLVTPADNPVTDGKISLGRKLFFDKRLSADGSVSCATCHDPERAFADTKPLAVGVYGRIGKRHSPTIVNRGFGFVHFWDGRATTLEAQVLQPIADPNEMDLPIAEAVRKLAANETYRLEFQMVFERPLSSDDVARALATYVRSIRSGDAPYDRFVAGDDTALTDEQKRGLNVFNRSTCGFCHREPTFSDERFWNTGVAWNPNTAGFTDDGRYEISRNERERGSFKTPTLREVARTAPYMHNGSLATLADVVEFYNQGGRRNRNTQIVRPLNLTDEDKQALVKFLESLSGVVTGK